MLCLQFLGAAKSRECRGGMAGLSDWTFDWAKPRNGSFLYYMYYTTQAKFQEGGDTWKAWNAQFSPALMTNQKVVKKEASGYVDHLGKPKAIGSWDSPAKEHGVGEVSDTILCTLMLEVYYRYLPTFLVVPADEAPAEDDIGDEEGELDIDFS